MAVLYSVLAPTIMAIQNIPVFCLGEKTIAIPLHDAPPVNDDVSEMSQSRMLTAPPSESKKKKKTPSRSQTFFVVCPHSQVPIDATSLVDPPARDEPSKGKDGDEAHGECQLDHLRVKIARGAAAPRALPIWPWCVGLRLVQAELEVLVGTQLAGRRELADLRLRVLDDEGVHLGEQRGLDVVGLLPGVPDIGDVRLESHVGGQGPSLTSGRAAEEDIDGCGLDLERGVVPSQGDVVSNLEQNGRDGRGDRRHDVHATHGGIGGDALRLLRLVRLLASARPGAGFPPGRLSSVEVTAAVLIFVIIRTARSGLPGAGSRSRRTRFGSCLSIVRVHSGIIKTRAQGPYR